MQTFLREVGAAHHEGSAHGMNPLLLLCGAAGTSLTPCHT